MKKILLSTDLSATSANLVSSIAGLKDFGVTSIVLTSVVDLKYSGSSTPELVSESEEMLIAQAEMLVQHGFSVKTELRSGVPWIEILNTARKHRVSAIVVGSHGKSIAREIVLGSVTAELIENADIPVMVLRMSQFDSARKARKCSAKLSSLFNNVLYPADFSEEAKDTVAFIREMAQYIKKLTIVHVQEPIITEQPVEIDMHEFDALDREKLDTLEKKLKLGFPAVKKVLHGLATMELEDMINTGKFSLVVMGTRGLGMPSRLLLGSTARHLVRHAKTPLIIIPKKGGAKQ